MSNPFSLKLSDYRFINTSFYLFSSVDMWTIFMLNHSVLNDQNNNFLQDFMA